VIFREAGLQGAFVIEPVRSVDDRGYFARTWCQREFAEHGLSERLAQCSLSFNQKKGTLRGMHYQEPPFAEAKLVQCPRGAIYDVIVDIRPSSPTFMKWLSIELSAENHLMLYVPEGFAHGFQTLTDETEVYYQISEFYAPESARGFRWNDPAFGIRWPASERVISSRDNSYPDFAQTNVLRA
jgi:dTDP-4-dehydrorhamnose 3,5-epimerase